MANHVRKTILRIQSHRRLSCLMLTALTPLCLALAPSALAATTNPDQMCSTTSSYSVNSVVGQLINRMGNVYTNYNGTPNDATAEFTAQTAGTSTVAISASGTFSIDAIIAGAQASTSITLTQSWYVGTGTSISITVPPYHYGNGEYGNWRWVTNGTYYTYGAYCQVTSSTNMRTSVPTNHDGWDTWIS